MKPLRLLPHLSLLVIFTLFYSCEKKEEATPNKAPTVAAPPVTPVDKSSYTRLNSDTCFNPTVTKYFLETGSFVINARGKNNEPNVYFYFKSAEPLAGKKYVLVDNRSQNTLSEGQAFARYFINGSNFYNYQNDTVEVVAYKDKKMLVLTNRKFTTDGSIVTRDCTIRIVF